jgi:Leucine-rich repeat (LRR) protein
MKKNDWLLIISVIVYSWMFYQQSAGINFLIFSAALVVLLLVRDKSLFRDRHWYLAASGTLVSGVCVALFGTTLAVVANVASLALLSALSISRSASVILSGLYASYSVVSSIGFMIADLIRRNASSARSRGSHFWMKLGIGAGILVIIIVFFILYQRSNPLFLDLTKKINLDFISWPWVRFTFLGFLILYGFFYSRNFPGWHRWDTKHPGMLSPDSYAGKENKIFNKAVNLSWEIYSGVILIALLNVLLLVVNTLDVYYLWITNDLPAGMTYSDYVHQGTTNLIISIALAILIILFFFRGHINFAANNKALKALAFVWIIQNILVLFSTAYRNYLYVAEYSLTYKRIGVYIWLVLTLIGLLTTFFKINGKKDNWYLFRANGLAFYIFLVFFACQNWDLIITQFNIQKSKKIDKYYLLDLQSPAVIPDLLTLAADTEEAKPDDAYPEDYLWDDFSYKPYGRSGIYEKDFTAELHKRMYNFLLDYKNSDWQSWNLGDHKTAQRIREMVDSGAFTKLSLTNMELHSVDIADMFSKIEEMDLRHNNITGLQTLAPFENLRSLNLGSNKLSEIQKLPAFTELKKIWLNDNGISDLRPLKSLQGLEYLNISSNAAGIDLSMLSALKNLKELDISNNSIEDYAPLKELTALRSLSLDNAKSGDFSGLPVMEHIEEISLSNNRLGNSSKNILSKFAQFTNLKKINLSGNQLRSLYVLTTYYELFGRYRARHERENAVEPLFAKLEDLDVAQNSLSDLGALEYYPGLKRLNLAGNQLDNISALGGMAHLEFLDISGTGTMALDSLAGLKTLRELNISDNPLTSLESLKNLRNLEILNASRCQVYDLAALSGLDKLRWLNISNCPVSDIGFLKSMRSIETLNLQGCSVEDYSVLSQMESLTTLYLDYYTERKIKRELQEKLPGVRIIYTNAPYRYRY